MVRACAADRVHSAGLRVRGSAQPALPPARGAWQRAGKPDAGDWAAGRPAVIPGAGQEACRISYCQLWAEPGAVLCYSHHRRWQRAGRPDLEGFAAAAISSADGRERADLTALPDRLRLEVQYALQCRHDDNTVTTRPSTVRTMVGWLAASGAASLLDRGEAGLAGRLPAPVRQGRAGGRPADLRSPHGERPRRGRRLGQRVPPRHLAHAPARRQLPVPGPALRRHHPAVAQGPGQTVDEMAAEHRPGSAELLPRRPCAHPALGVPRRCGHRRR